MEYIDGQAVLENYSISVGELVKAILDGLPAYDAVTGKRVVDQDSMIARPKYETEEQAAKAVDLIDAGFAASRMRRGEKPFSTYAPGGASGIDAIVRRNKIRLFMETAKVYEFPAGQDRPQEPCGIFPLRYDTFSREYSGPVMLGLHGEGESIQGLYQKQIGAMRFPVASVEARFGSTATEKTLDVRHVQLTPNQDWLGNAIPLLSLKHIGSTISLSGLLSRWVAASGNSRGELSELLIHFIKHGLLRVYEPRQAGSRILYAPSSQDAAAIEIDCATASLGGWGAELPAVAALSGLFADMAEVETIEAQYHVLKPIASETNGQELGQPAPKVDVEGESTGRGKPTAEPNPESLITTLRENGVTDTKELAAEVDKHFPGLSYAKLGKLLPATSGAMVSYEGQKSQGQRLRGKK